MRRAKTNSTDDSALVSGPPMEVPAHSCRPRDRASDERGLPSCCVCAAVYAFADRLGRFENFLGGRSASQKRTSEALLVSPVTWQSPRAVDARLRLCILHDKAGSRAAGRTEGFRALKHDGKMHQRQRGRAETSAKLGERRVQGNP